MKFRNLILPVLLLAAPIAQAQSKPEYTLVAADRQWKQFWIVDKHNVKDTPFGTKRAWVYFFNFGDDRIKNVAYTLVKTEFDCRNETFKSEYSALYDADGNVISSGPVPNPSARPWIPESTFASVSDRICHPEKMELIKSFNDYTIEGVYSVLFQLAFNVKKGPN